jgi:hypothetical protein
VLASLFFLLFCLSDWLLLRLLPHLQLSFAPSTGLPLIASLLVRAAILAALTGALLLARRRRQAVTGVRLGRSALILFLFINLGFSAVQVDAYVVEPLLVETTHLALQFDQLDPAGPPVRLVHLTDLHLERSGLREARIIQQVNDLRPDLILLTGDYLNLSYLGDPVAAEHFRDLIAQLDAPYGIYAVRGTVEPVPDAMAWLIRDTGIVWLEQEAVTVSVRGQSLTLAGVACSHHQQRDVERLRQTLDGISTTGLTVLLYHSPDLIREAAGMEVDLYLAGHTHGGQIRLPVLGAIVTDSVYGRRYTSGLFQEGGTTMYVSRGLGFEGSWLPRARFLCRPEIVGIELAAAVP